MSRLSDPRSALPTMETEPERPWWFVALVGRSPRRTLFRILVLTSICFLGWKFVVVPIKVQGISMLPTFKNGQVNFVNRLAYVLGAPQRGDVVAIRMAGERIMLLKRIVGLPGETLCFRNGRLMINGHVMLESYVKLPCNWNTEAEVIPHGYYYVVGDNRSMNEWDHTKGKAELHRIVGRTIL